MSLSCSLVSQEGRCEALFMNRPMHRFPLWFWCMEQCGWRMGHFTHSPWLSGLYFIIYLLVPNFLGDIGMKKGHLRKAEGFHGSGAEVLLEIGIQRRWVGLECAGTIWMNVSKTCQLPSRPCMHLRGGLGNIFSFKSTSLYFPATGDSSWLN